MYISDLNKIWLATGASPIYLEPAMANRHGLIAGATGTGKTVTLKVLAEAFSDMGVPVFLADIKGDVSGMCRAGHETKHIRRSLDAMGLEARGYHYAAYPVRFFDVYGKLGHPVRTTISEMGPELLSRLLDLNDTQSGVLRIVFRIADERGLLLVDLKDLRSLLQYAADNAKEYKLTYGNISAQSVGAIQRALLQLEDEGGDLFFGEPALDLSDWFDWDEAGRGMMNILECRELFQHPLLYGTFLLWMLSELYELLPEAGDLDKPKIAFFFDEAHLLFRGAPKALVEKVEQVARLIRSKGVSVWFISQNPTDIPDTVLSQIGNRVQHALRAEIQASSLAGKYDAALDRYSAYEQLSDLRERETADLAAQEEAERLQAREAQLHSINLNNARGGRAPAPVRGARVAPQPVRGARAAAQPVRRTQQRRQPQDPLQRAMDSAAYTVGRELGKTIVRGLFGTYRNKR